MRIVDYYMSLNSPWSYLGSARLAELAHRHGCKVDIKPVNFGEVFARTGGLPQRSRERQAYRQAELARWRDHLGIPIQLRPRHHPANELRGIRTILAAKFSGYDAHALATEIGRAMWEREEDIAEVAVLSDCAKRANVDADLVHETRRRSADLDAEYHLLTAEAITRGVFGAPSYVLESGEIFWGQDRLEFLDRALGR
jgi:2-hydroxychromene-2-carboxylate isomerase